MKEISRRSWWFYSLFLFVFSCTSTTYSVRTTSKTPEKAQVGRQKSQSVQQTGPSVIQALKNEIEKLKQADHLLDKMLSRELPPLQRIQLNLPQGTVEVEAKRVLSVKSEEGNTSFDLDIGTQYPVHCMMNL